MTLVVRRPCAAGGRADARLLRIAGAYSASASMPCGARRARVAGGAARGARGARGAWRARCARGARAASSLRARCARGARAASSRGVPRAVRARRARCRGGTRASKVRVVRIPRGTRCAQCANRARAPARAACAVRSAPGRRARAVRVLGALAAPRGAVPGPLRPRSWERSVAGLVRAHHRCQQRGGEPTRCGTDASGTILANRGSPWSKSSNGTAKRRNPAASGHPQIGGRPRKKRESWKTLAR